MIEVWLNRVALVVWIVVVIAFFTGCKDPSYVSLPEPQLTYDVTCKEDGKVVFQHKGAWFVMVESNLVVVYPTAVEDGEGWAYDFLVDRSARQDGEWVALINQNCEVVHRCIKNCK